MTSFALVARPFLFEFGGVHGNATISASLSRLGMAGLYKEKMKIGKQKGGKQM